MENSNNKKSDLGLNHHVLIKQGFILAGDALLTPTFKTAAGTSEKK